jgi:hypothetical protein
MKGVKGEKVKREKRERKRRAIFEFVPLFLF